MYGRKWKDTGSSGSSSSACYDSQHMGSSVSTKSTVSSPRHRNSFQILCSQVLLGAVGGPLPHGVQIFYSWWLGIQPWGTGQGCRTLPAHPAIQQKGHASTAIPLSGWNSLCAIHVPMYRCQKKWCCLWHFRSRLDKVLSNIVLDTIWQYSNIALPGWLVS